MLTSSIFTQKSEKSPDKVSPDKRDGRERKREEKSRNREKSGGTQDQLAAFNAAIVLRMVEFTETRKSID